MTVPDAHFSGSDYDDDRDRDRLRGQILRVFDAMQSGLWFSLDSLAKTTGDPPASVSAQLRHLRKERFGAHTVEKNHLGDGMYVYRLTVNVPEPVRCEGCRHFQATYETCRELAGQVTCMECDHVYSWEELGRMKCPNCTAWKGAHDLSDCANGVPSSACPGRCEPEVVQTQGTLFE